MARYLPLLNITAEHGFYANGLCRGLRFTPSADTAAWLQSVDAVCRETGAGLLVLGVRAGLRADGGDATPAPPLCWSLRCEDPRFAAVTAGLPAQRDELLVFRSSASGASAVEGQVWPRQWPAVAEQLSAAQHKRPPLALLQLPVPVPVPGAQAGPAQHSLRFAARAPIWKYCLVGPWSSDPLEVVAGAGEPGFGEPVSEQLDNGQRVLAFRSVAGIELRERSDKRFQLRARSAAADRVLVKRLPVAGADHFAHETIHGVSTLVSEIYVHR